ncbi:MAG: B12-binding domain-containing radical SAM protein [Candidatus Sericytochromatia bacterium]
MRVGLLYVDNFQLLRSQRIGSLGLGYIAAYIQRALPGLEVHIAVTPEELIALECDLVGVSAYTETLPVARAYAAQIRAARDIPLVLGGPHIATNPADLPPEFDFGVAGEGEELFLKLVELQLSNGLVPQHLNGLQGLTHRVDGQLRDQGRCPSIENMDALAHPDRRKMFVSMQRHFKDFDPVLHIHTARGCPYRCTFCSAPLVNPSWRFHSPEWVIEDIEQIARDFPECREITLSDDLFTLKKSRLAALVQAIREAGFHKRFAFFCSSRSNTLTHDMCRLLRDMNVRMISFGLESASDRLIKDLKGVGTSQGDYDRVLGMCEHYGLLAHGNFIIGAQDETLPDLQQTWRFVQTQKDRLSSIYFSHMTPFPGTKVWDDGLAAGRFDPQTLDYRVLNLDYARGSSVFLNTHYDEDTYAPAYARFKQFETWLDDRYYGDQSLIADLMDQEREIIPDALVQLFQHEGWQTLDVITDRDPWLLELPAGMEIRQYSRQQVLEGAELSGDASVLFYSLDEMRDATPLLERLPARPVVSLNYHIGAYTVVAQLLLGVFQETVYGPLRRRHLRHFTLKSLRRLMEGRGYQLRAVRPNRYRLPLNYAPLKQLFGDQLADPDMFSFVTRWEPPLQS